MKRAIVTMILIMASASAFADQWVNGYTRRDGTYVDGHYRSEPNQNRYDNYSSQGNSNPYTGQQGSGRNEWSTPPRYNNSYGGGSGRSYNGYYGNRR